MIVVTNGIFRENWVDRGIAFIKKMNSFTKERVLSLIYWLGTILAPIVLFFILIIRQPLIILPNFLNNRTIFGFLSILVLFGISFHIRGKFGWLAGSILSVLFFSAPFISMLRSGFSNAAVIGSFLPYKDGFSYYNGARTLLIGQPISSGWNDIFRPLFPGILAFILFLTSNNLMLSLSIFIFGMGFGCYTAARQVRELFGPWPAALFMALMVVFSRRFIGYTWTELPGILLGSIAFILLIKGSMKQNLLDLNLGGILLVLALSIRAGAFAILPLIPLWAGLIFQNEKKFNLKVFLVVALPIAVSFILANYTIPRLLTSPGNTALSNFAYTLYGQAKGGAGWYQAIEEFQTTDTSYIMREAIDLIRRYPLGIFIGTVKAYRDFFSPNIDGVFNLITEKNTLVSILFWAANIALLILGILRSIRSIRKPVFSLILICLVGLLFSIPFAPPVDNGNRLYAGSIAFLFVLSAIGLQSIITKSTSAAEESAVEENSSLVILRIFSAALCLTTLVSPLVIKSIGKIPDFAIAQCTNSQIPFTLQIYEGSYINISNISNENCGSAGNLCLTDFEKNGADKKNDDFFRMIVQKAKASLGGLRIIASVDLPSLQYYYFIGPPDLLPTENPQGIITGCATKIQHNNQKALWVDSILK